MAGKEERNKRSAIAFYDLMFNQSNPREAVEEFVGDDYRQHNPFGADGKEAFVEYFERMARDRAGWRVALGCSDRIQIGRPDPEPCEMGADGVDHRGSVGDKSVDLVQLERRIVGIGIAGRDDRGRQARQVRRRRPAVEQQWDRGRELLEIMDPRRIHADRFDSSFEGLLGALLGKIGGASDGRIGLGKDGLGVGKVADRQAEPPDGLINGLSHARTPYGRPEAPNTPHRWVDRVSHRWPRPSWPRGRPPPRAGPRRHAES